MIKKIRPTSRPPFKSCTPLRINTYPSRHASRPENSNPKPLAQPNSTFLSLKSFDYGCLLEEKILIDRMREKKLASIRAQCAGRAKAKTTLNKYVSQLSIADLNYLRSPVNLKKTREQSLDPIQIQVKAKIRAGSRQVPESTWGMTRTDSVETPRPNLEKLTALKTNSNILKLMGSPSKKKLTNLKTTTIEGGTERIPYNRYKRQEETLKTSNGVLILDNKENMIANSQYDTTFFDQHKQSDYGQQPEVQLARLGNSSARSILLYKNKVDMNRMLGRPEQIRFDLIKKRVSQMKANQRQITEVDQWNLEYLKYTKN